MLRRLLVVALALSVLTALPAASSSGPVRDVVRSAALSLGTTVASLSGERLVGVTWTSGSATVTYRWVTASGRSEWHEAHEDTTEEGTPGTAPIWRPAGALAVELRVTGSARGLRLARVSDGKAGRVWGAVAHAETGRAVLGVVGTRAQWGADESLVRRSPSYSSSVQAVVVHHTADLNSYSRADVPRIIRADYSYHVQTRGWSDLGYNLLVDRFGGIWEGRRGGIGRAVLGSHTQGFNTGTLGVSYIGDTTREPATAAGRKALARVIAYASSTWRWDHDGTVRLRSKGSPRYPSGRLVTLPRVFGHGQTGVTACPGSLQQDLPALRRLASVALTPAPRVLSSRLTGAPLHAPEPVTLDVRMSKRVAWRMAFHGPEGTLVAGTRGTSATARLSWDGMSRGALPLPATPGTYGWSVTADDGFHDVVTKRGTFEVGLPDALALLQS